MSIQVPGADSGLESQPFKLQMKPRDGLKSPDVQEYTDDQERKVKKIVKKTLGPLNIPEVKGAKAQEHTRNGHVEDEEKVILFSSSRLWKAHRKPREPVELVVQFYAGLSQFKQVILHGKTRDT